MGREKGPFAQPSGCPRAWTQEELDRGSRAGGQRLTFLSRKDAIRPKFLGCCMNLRKEKGGPETRPRGASQLGGR